MATNNDFKTIFNAILKHDKILIAGHKNPDTDCIGACISFGLVLEKLGKNPAVYIKDMPHEFEVLKGSRLFVNKVEGDFDLVIVLDCADDGRFEIKQQFKNAKETINIDHHIVNPYFATYNYVDDKASSCCEILYDLFKENNVEFDKDICEAIFAGILGDTAQFQNRNTTKKTMVVCSELMGYEVDQHTLITRLFNTKTFSELKLFGRALDNAKIYHNGDIIMSSLTKEEIAELKAKSNETSGIISMLREAEGTKIACFVYEPIPHNVKVSLRCDIPYDVCEVAATVGGGGHVLASGAIVKNIPIEEVKEKLLNAMIMQIEKFEK